MNEEESATAESPSKTRGGYNGKAQTALQSSQASNKGSPV
jgi:hypothetical protein